MSADAFQVTLWFVSQVRPGILAARDALFGPAVEVDHSANRIFDCS